MTKRVILIVTCVPCLFAALSIAGLFARDQAPPAWKALEIRYAQANLELANARLAQAESQNKLTAGTIDPDTIELLKGGVKLAQAQLRQLDSQTGSNANPYAPQVLATEYVIAALANNHNESLQANKLQPGAVPAAQLQREQAEIDVARARLAALQSLAQQPLEVRLKWEIGQLQDDIRSLWARPLITD
jgi:hypothetical protein